jgi:hypothetical protein
MMHMRWQETQTSNVLLTTPIKCGMCLHKVKTDKQQRAAQGERIGFSWVALMRAGIIKHGSQVQAEESRGLS